MFHRTSGLLSASFLLLLTCIIAATWSSTSAQEQTSSSRAFQEATPATVTGELTLQYADDFVNGRSELIHTLRDERTGRSFRLRFERGLPSNLRSGMRVKVRGRSQGENLYVAPDDGEGPTVLALDASVTTTAASTGSFALAAPVSGDQKTLVIVANFRDAIVNPLRPGADCSIQAIGDRVFSDPSGNSVDALYREISGGQVSLSGRVAGPYTLSASSADACANNTWAAAADALASADGIDVGSYARKVYVLPSSTCAGAGLADLGVKPSRAWVFTCDVPHVYAHELGHNLGMHHAATETSEYGDDSDIMGMNGGLLPVNAPHKTQMGWLGAAATVAVTSPGVYDLAPLALPASLASRPQVLTVRKPGSEESYYISYRHGDGFEANACCTYLDRISVHRWSGGSNKTYLLASLADGESYVDPATGFKVSQVSHTAESASAMIEMGSIEAPLPCEAKAPVAVLSPRDQTGATGISVRYDVSIVNQDPAGCSPSTFTLSGFAPSTWTTMVTGATTAVAPGETAYGQLTVSVPAGASAAVHQVGIGISSASAPVHATSTAGSYTVRPTTTTDTTAPTAPIGLTAAYKRGQVKLSWQPATDQVGVAGYRLSRNGASRGTTSALAWADAAVAAGSTYSYSVEAFDAAGNVSPAATVTIKLAGGGKGK